MVDREGLEPPTPHITKKRVCTAHNLLKLAQRWNPSAALCPRSLEQANLAHKAGLATRRTTQTVRRPTEDLAVEILEEVGDAPLRQFAGTSSRATPSRTAQQELAKTACLFDLAEHRLGQLLAQPVGARVPTGLIFARMSGSIPRP